MFVGVMHKEGVNFLENVEQIGIKSYYFNIYLVEDNYDYQLQPPDGYSLILQRLVF